MGFRFEGFLISPVIGFLYSVVRKEGFGGIKKAGWEVKKAGWGGQNQRVGGQQNKVGG